MTLEQAWQRQIAWCDANGSPFTARVLEAAHDYFDLDGLLTPEERVLRHRVRTFVDAEIVPSIGAYFVILYLKSVTRNSGPPLPSRVSTRSTRP